MTPKAFWHNSTVGVIGGGSWGTVLATLVATQVRSVRFKVRDIETARAINATRVHPKVFSHLTLPSNLISFSQWEEFFETRPQVLIWVLPSNVCRMVAREIAPFLQGDEIILHATKGVEAETMKRVSVMLAEELPLRRIGVISGPNLAHEIAHGQPASTVVASRFDEVREAGMVLLDQPRFRVVPETDVIGVEWAGTLKNILAIAAGALDALAMGWSARAMLLTEGLREIVRFGKALGANESTFLGLAGMGDLLATCSSSLSRNYRVGYLLAEGHQSLETVLRQVGSTAEGVQTTFHVGAFARGRKIHMPITMGVSELLQGNRTARELLEQLMLGFGSG